MSVKRTDLVMYSGGLDSTYLLYQMLKEQKYPIHVHHINIKRKQNLQKPEKQIIEQALPIFKKYGEFEYTESTIDLSQCNLVSYDQYYHNLMALNVGLNIDSDEVHVYRGIHYSEMYVPNKPFEIKQREYQAVLSRGTKLQYKIHYPFKKRPDIDKRKIYFELLPDDLRDMQQGCRRPIEKDDGAFEECKQCSACKKLRLYGIRK